MAEIRVLPASARPEKCTVYQADIIDFVDHMAKGFGKYPIVVTLYNDPDSQDIYMQAGYHANQK